MSYLKVTCAVPDEESELPGAGFCDTACPLPFTSTVKDLSAAILRTVLMVLPEKSGTALLNRSLSPFSMLVGKPDGAPAFTCCTIGKAGLCGKTPRYESPCEAISLKAGAATLPPW